MPWQTRLDCEVGIIQFQPRYDSRKQPLALKIEMHNTAPRTQASEERLRRAMLGDRGLQKAAGLGREYDDYFEALHDEYAAVAGTTDWEFAQRLKAAGCRDWAERADVAERERDARLEALWIQAESR